MNLSSIGKWISAIFWALIRGVGWLFGIIAYATRYTLAGLAVAIAWLWGHSSRLLALSATWAWGHVSKHLALTTVIVVIMAMVATPSWFAWRWYNNRQHAITKIEASASMPATAPSTQPATQPDTGIWSTVQNWTSKIGLDEYWYVYVLCFIALVVAFWYRPSIHRLMIPVGPVLKGFQYTVVVFTSYLLLTMVLAKNLAPTWWEALRYSWGHGSFLYWAIPSVVVFTALAFKYKHRASSIMALIGVFIVGFACVNYSGTLDRFKVWAKEQEAAKAKADAAAATMPGAVLRHRYPGNNKPERAIPVVADKWSPVENIEFGVHFTVDCNKKIYIRKNGNDKQIYTLVPRETPDLGADVRALEFKSFGEDGTEVYFWKSGY